MRKAFTHPNWMLALAALFATMAIVILTILTIMPAVATDHDYTGPRPTTTESAQASSVPEAPVGDLSSKTEPSSSGIVALTVGLGALGLALFGTGFVAFVRQARMREAPPNTRR